jgi:hypothetical protein
MDSSYYSTSFSKLATHVTPSKDTFGIGDYGNDSHYGKIPDSSFAKPTDATKYANPTEGDFDITTLNHLSPPTNDAYNAEPPQQLYETKQRVAEVTRQEDDFIARNHKLNHDVQQAETVLVEERAIHESRNLNVLRNERIKAKQAFSSFVSLILPKDKKSFPSQLDRDDNDAMRNCIYGAKLGEGAFGAVFKAKQLKNNKQVAIKLVDADSEYLMGEIYALQRTDHPNIIKLYDTLWDIPSKKCGLVFELGFSDLEAYKKNGNIITVKEVRQVSRATIKALAYLHSQNIGHMDVKPANIMIKWEHSGIVEHNIKLVDLGLVTIGGEEMMMKGTRGFFAPEIASSGIKYRCEAADMWSYGASIVDLLDRFPENWNATYDLYYDPEAIDHKAFQDGLKFHVKGMKRVDYGLDSHAMDLALALLKYKPGHRLTAEEALQHPWLAPRL